LHAILADAALDCLTSSHPAHASGLATELPRGSPETVDAGAAAMLPPGNPPAVPVSCPERAGVAPEGTGAVPAVPEGVAARAAAAAAAADVTSSSAWPPLPPPHTESAVNQCGTAGTGGELFCLT
jgi:hypothetical protein